MRSCCAEPSEGMGDREAERESLPARCGRWLSDLLHRLCPCLPRSPEREPEPTDHGTEVPKRRAPRTGVRRKWRKCTAGVEPAPNTSRSTPESTLPPEDAAHLTMGQRLPRPSSSPRMGQPTCIAWEPEHVPNIVPGSQPSTTLESQVLHHLVQEEHLGPTVAELEDPRQTQLAPETQGGPASCLEPVQELPESPGLELRPVSPASTPAEPEDVPAVASAPGPGPELEPHVSTAESSRPSSSPRMGRARRIAWEPEHVPNIVPGSQPSTTLEGQVLHHLVQEEHLGPTVAELEDPRQTQLAPETQGGPASCLEPVQELSESPGLELRPVSPASTPAEPEDVPAVSSAPGPGPELEPHVSTAESSRPSSSPRIGRARRIAWEPEHVPNIVPGSQPSTTLEGQVLHHLVQEEHLGPTVAELEDPRQTQLAPETQGGPASWLEPVQELPESPGLELRPVSPASACAESEDVPAVASALGTGPELEPHVSTAESSRPSSSPRMGRARRIAWEREHVPIVIDVSNLSSTLVDQDLHHLVQEEHLGTMVAELEDPRQTQLAPETQGGPASWLEPVQELPESPWLELRPVSPASACAEPEDVPGVPSAPGTGPDLEPHEPSGPGPMTPAGMAPGLAEPEADPEPTSASVAITRDVLRKEERTILQFPAHLVAEQLTLMCAGLYSRVDYSECKAYVESQPLMKGIELLAPNVQMVIRQFDAMVSLVISSCLGTLTMTARDRAQVVEFWIQVAKECLALKNFAALRAILVGLRSRAIRHLESTWGRVSWKSSRIYKKLQKRDEKANREWLLKEVGAVVKQQLCAPNRSQDRKKQGMVPFLGLFLRDVPVDQLPEYNEDVTTLQLEIMLHKHVAGLYDLEPEERFVSFFQAVEPLDEEESYSLSCQLESRGQEAGREGVLPPYGWCNMLTYWPGPAAVIGPSPLLASWLHAEQSLFPFGPAAPGAPGP
ncbi:uncharacterized protein [Manis javanica]|uniref:uncharacterized protein isoform X2 n=1 Tax=Manis javanica TaxID=9974 RepID=UPI003C6D0FE0